MAIIDERTPNLNLPLPVKTNALKDDVGRLREAFDILDNALDDFTASYPRIFPTVEAMVSYGHLSEGLLVKTQGYYSPGDGGGCEYLIKSGVPNNDFSDAGSVVITPTLFAKLIQQPSFDLKQFGVVPADQSAATSNDTFIANAVMRSRFGFCKIIISDVVYHKKPIVLDYYNHIEGNVIGSDAQYTPRFIKVDNSSSGIPALDYPGQSSPTVYDVDAGIIIKRQTANTDFCRGITIKGFLLQSLLKSSWGIYAPFMADFDIDVDSRGFNCGVRFNIAFLGRLAGRHVGLGTSPADGTTSIGLWASSPPFVADCGNSVRFRLSLNGFNRAWQMENFGNAIAEAVTFENIKKATETSPEPYGLFITSSSISGQISCESSKCCALRIGNNAVADITLSAQFHDTQHSTAEGFIHVLSGGRLNLRPSTILADEANTLIINESGGFLEIASTTRTINTIVQSNDNYRIKNKMATSGQTLGATGTSFGDGSEITFGGIGGMINLAALQSGIITFQTAALVKITATVRSTTTGQISFGLNHVSSGLVAPGQTTTIMVKVSNGDTLNIIAVGALNLASAGGVGVLIEPVS